MKNLRKLLAFLTLALSLAAVNPLRADDSGKPSDDGTTSENSGKGKGRGKGGLEIPRLGIPPKVELPEALKKLVDQYRADSDTFLASQKDLLKQLKGATEEEKAKIKETLKANREKFLADHKELISEIRQQIADLKKELKNHEKPVDAGNGGKGGGRRGND